MLSARSLFVLLLSSLLIIGCSGNSSSSINTGKRVEQVTGYVGAANINSATLQAVPINNQGKPDTAINGANVRVRVGLKTVSAETGFYSVGFDDEKKGLPFVVIATSPSSEGKMHCELVSGCGSVAYKGKIDLAESFEYRALVTDVAANMSINVNWMTHVANAYAYTSYIDTTDDNINNPVTPRAGTYTRYTISLANQVLSRIFELPDILSVRPIAPSKIAEQTNLPLLLQEKGIMYGALLASIQQLKPADTSLTDFLNGFIGDFNSHKGKWLQKRTVAGSGPVALYDIYDAAEKVLQDNVNYLRGLKVVVPGIADAVIADFKRRKAVFVAGEYTPDYEITLSESAKAELNKVAEAKVFIEDLNNRFLNFDGSKEGVSFVDKAYADKVRRYTTDVGQGFRSAAPSLQQALITVKNAIDYYGSVLNGTPDGTNPLASSGRVTVLDNFKLPDNPDSDGIKDASKLSSKKLKITSPGGGELFMSYVLNKKTPRKPTDANKAFLFRVFIEGTIIENGLTINFSVGNETSGDNTKPYIDVEYSNEYATPVPLSVEEPLTYKIVWPLVATKIKSGNDEHDFEQLFEAELVGIRDPLIASSEIRYNLKRLSYRALDKGPLLDTITKNDGSKEVLRDASEGVVTLTSSVWSLYYPESKWPKLSDYLTFRPGYDVTKDESDVFQYFVDSEDIEVEGVNQTINFLDLLTLAADGSVLAGKRYRMLPVADSKEQFQIQMCKLNVTNLNAVSVVSCGEKVKRLGREEAGKDIPSIEQLAEKLLPEIVSVSGRGYFAPLFTRTLKNSVAELTRKQWVKLNGRVVRQVSNLFEYYYGEETVDNKLVEFLDIIILSDPEAGETKGKRTIAQRYRQHLIDGVSDRFFLERCSIPLTDLPRKVTASCDAKVEVAGEAKIKSMVEELSRLSFSVPTRGGYLARFPSEIVVLKDEKTGKYSERRRPLPITKFEEKTVDGYLTTPISMGFETLTLRFAVDIYEKDADGKNVKIGPMLVDVKMKILAENVFDIALTFGYDYKYLIGVLPSGDNAQSFYVTYQSGIASDGFASEVGKLAVFRTGYTISGSETSIGLHSDSEVSYQLTDAPSAKTACGVANRQKLVKSCDAVAYLGYRGTLLSVVREERKNVYVARFINGDFVILGK